MTARRLPVREMAEMVAMQTDGPTLNRFVEAQHPVYAQVCAELRSGRKSSHWMWFIFPQIAGLGQSAMSQRYALGGIEEATAYLAHPVLGRRLRECTALVLGVHGVSAARLFGHPDDLKFQSCMTLFMRAASADACFSRALDMYFHGRPDTATLHLLDLAGPTPVHPTAMQAPVHTQAADSPTCGERDTT